MRWVMAGPVDVRRARQPAESAKCKKPNTSGRGCGLWVDAASAQSRTGAESDREGAYEGPARIESHDGRAMALTRPPRAVRFARYRSAAEAASRARAMFRPEPT